MASNTFTLASATRIKILLGIENDDSEKYDAVIQEIMNNVTYQMEGDLNRIIQYQENRIQYFDFIPPLETLRVDCFPVDLTKSFSIWIDYARVFDAGTLIGSSEYGVDPDTGIIGFNWRRYLPFVQRGYKMIKIQYSGGMAKDTSEFEANYPDISGAFVTECAERFQTRQTVGKIAVTLQGGSVTFGKRGLFLDLVQQVLDGHSRL